MRKILFLTNNQNATGLFEWLVAQGENIMMFEGKIDRRFIDENAIDFIISYNY
ncbi:MAG: hypothetical protein LBQ52_09010 [Helicobacteraceae bacterium]|jgi:hypothetical protein|nr:hypothetical protein [Helicobacteraceae bacterium]